MKITIEGLALIKEFEGFRSAAYRDAVGVWTIGYGHTSMAGAPHVKAGLVVTKAEANDILARDVEQFADGVRKLLQVNLSPTQFSALVSFSYNVGLGNFKKSSVLAAVNRRDFAAVGRRLQLWTKAGGRVLPGLVRRRAAEAALFASEGDAVIVAPVERVEAKPVLKSKTVLGAFGALLLAMVQTWLAMGQKVAAIILLLSISALLALIIYERVKKLKEEAL
jgi:lysozyme